MDIRMLREAARELGSLADRHAIQDEAARRLHPEVLAALEGGPLLRAMLPVECGGVAMPVTGMAELVAQVSRGCGSAGLCVAWYVGHLWMAAMFPQSALSAVLASGRPLITGALSPRGVLKANGDGGLHLSGEWPYATSIVDAQWLIATAERRMPGGELRTLSCLIPRAGFSSASRWTAMGMQATGTDGVSVESWHLGEEFVVDYNELLAGKVKTWSDAVQPYPFDMPTVIGMAACAVGMAERIYEEVRRDLYPQTSAARVNAVRYVDMGSHFGRLRMAYSAMMRMAEDLHSLVSNGNPVTSAMRHGMRVTASEIIEQCVLSSVTLATQCGTHVLLAEHPIQRFVRDLIVLSSHSFVRADLARGAFREQFVRPMPS